MTHDLDPDRLAVVDAIDLGPGQHPTPNAGACVMEAVAYVAGEDWSDTPECASPVIAGLLRTWNDALDDRRRQELKGYVARLAGSRGTPDQERHRAELAAAWFDQHGHALPAGHRGRAIVARAVDVARAIGTDKRLTVADPRPPKLARHIPWISRRAVDAVHQLVDELLAVTETPDSVVLVDEVQALVPEPAPAPTGSERPAGGPPPRNRRARRMSPAPAPAAEVRPGEPEEAPRS